MVGTKELHSQCVASGRKIEETKFDKGNKLRERITPADYLALPESGSLPKSLEEIELGTKYRNKGGYICQVVKGEDMPEGQWSALSVPERGLLYYMPAFI